MMGQRSQNGRVHRCLNCVIAIAASVSVFVGRASGQFLMQPLKLELSPRAGELVKENLLLQNTSADQQHTITLRVLELSQDDDAVWSIVEPGSGFDTSKLSSCKDWIKLQYETLQLRPMTILPVSLEMRVPRNARGFYAAAIHVEMSPVPRMVQGRAVLLQFSVLAPVLVQIEGWAPPHKVELTDVGMRFQQEPNKPATSIVTMSVANDGGSYSRLQGKVWLSAISGDNVRQIATPEFLECSIIPGVQVTLKSDIERSLPSGKYRLQGTLFVDGRRVKPIEKEIDFIGDPRLTRAAADAALDLRPLDVSVQTQPGATRTETLTVTNASNERVNVTTAVAIPPVLTGVGIPERGLTGDDLNCAPWVEVVPKEFTIAPGRSQNLRIITRMPNPIAVHAWYYALLYLRATYPDGQNAGVRKAYICVSNKQVEAKPQARPWPLQIEHQGRSEYNIKGTFFNDGEMHFRPSCMAIIRMPDGAYVRSLLLSGQPEDVMLPLEPRTFSGVLDFAGIPNGFYRLAATLQYGTADVVTVPVPINVSGTSDQKVVEITTTQEFEQKVGVKWR